MSYKVYFLFLIIAIPYWINSTVLYVSHDLPGTYSSVQSAVNASAEHDTIMVYPGRYVENLMLVSKTLILRGMYEPSSLDSLLITIIDGNQSGSCVVVTDSSDIMLENLYLTNGSGYRRWARSYTSGGGIYSLDSTLEIKNCLIIRNEAFDAGGVCFFTSSVYLSGTEISNNRSSRSSGVSLVTSNVVFDPVNLCSIYLNYGTTSNDISMAAIGYDIILDKFTVANPDDEFVYNSVSDLFNLSYQRVAIEQIGADLYVNPNGNDNNDGLTAQTPLKTIAFALIKIQADSLNTRIIHLAEGVYSKSLNGQQFPLNMRSYVTVQGENASDTIIDGEHKYFAAIGRNGEKDCGLKNLTIRNGGSEISYGVITFSPRYYNNDINGLLTKSPRYSLENIKLINCTVPIGTPNSETQSMSVISSGYAEQAVLKNIEVRDCNGNIAVSIQGGNTYVENLLIHNYTFYNVENCGVPISISRNSYSDNFEGPNFFVNVRITYCLTNNDPLLYSSMISVGNYLTGTQIPIENYLINSTITHNFCRWSNGSAIRLKDNGRLTIVNSIIYNNRPCNIRLDASDDDPCRLRILNSLISNDTSIGYTNILSYGNNNILEWFGTNLDTIPYFDISDDENPYCLNSASPCIDAGTNEFSIFPHLSGFMFPSLDLAGNPRIHGSHVDMGCYEWNGTGIEDEYAPEATIRDVMVYPNPFHLIANIAFYLPKDSDAKISIYNTKGQLVRELVNDNFKQGYNKAIWDGKDKSGNKLATGIYCCKIQSKTYSLTKKITLFR